MNNTKKIVGEWDGEPIWQYVGSRPVGVAKIEEDKNRNTRLYLLLMEGKITNKEFEILTGAEPTENNPSRKDWEERNKVEEIPQFKGTLEALEKLTEL